MLQTLQTGCLTNGPLTLSGEWTTSVDLEQTISVSVNYPIVLWLAHREVNKKQKHSLIG